MENEETPGAKPEQVIVPVRATVHLPGLPRDAEALIDASDPYMQGLLEAGFLIPIGAPDALPAGE